MTNSICWNSSAKEIKTNYQSLNEIKSTLEQNKKRGFAEIEISEKKYHVHVDNNGKYIVKRDFSESGIVKKFFGSVFGGDFSKCLSNRLNNTQNTPVNFYKTPNVITRTFNEALYGDVNDRRGNATVPKNGERVLIDGYAGKLSGVRYHKDGNKKTVIFIHGSGSSAEKQSKYLAKKYMDNGFDVVAINMRGYGNSDGVPSEKGLYSDSREIFNYVNKTIEVNHDNIILHGYSLGAPIASKLFSDLENEGIGTNGLILDRPMPSMSSAISAHGITNPLNIVSGMSSSINGKFDVQKNLSNINQHKDVMLITDNEGLGREGDNLRVKLSTNGWKVYGDKVNTNHLNTPDVMDNQMNNIKDFSNRKTGSESN